ncbi:ATP-binding protein [Streptomyces sp. CA-111067]|uniref:ATP-binding protein n=1 Tax=Streptomyces sp. CA-111067 TaxID=3240046 RepID=UPI003D9905C5
MKTTATVASSTGHPAYSQTMPCTAPSAGGARRLVAAALVLWRLEELTDAAVLVVSELVGNAVRHTRSHQVLVAVSRPAAGLVRIEVTDRSRELPVLQAAGADAVRGRGLLTVDAVATRWGSEPLPSGKRVWCELALPDTES